MDNEFEERLRRQVANSELGKLSAEQRDADAEEREADSQEGIADSEKREADTQEGMAASEKREADAEDRQAKAADLNNKIAQEEYNLRKAQGQRNVKDLAKEGWNGAKGKLSAENLVNHAKKGGQFFATGGAINIMFWLSQILVISVGNQTNSDGLSYYLGFGLFTWLTIFHKEEYISKESLKMLGFAMGLAFFTFMMPKVIGLIPSIGVLDHQIKSIIAFVFNGYLVYFVLLHPVTPMLNLINKIFVVILVIIALAIIVRQRSLAIPELGGETYDTKAAWVAFRDLIVQSWNVVWDWSMGLYDDSKRGLIRLINDSTGGMMGRTEPGATEKLGVYFDQTLRTQNNFYVNEEIGVYAVLKANTLDDPIPVRASCYADYSEGSTDVKKNIAADLVTPTTETIYQKEKKTIDCQFSPMTLEEGSHSISIIVDYDFTTTARQKAYFVDKDRAQSLLSNDIDILDQYGIKDKNPIATYTNGPVRVGMSFRDQPVKLSPTSLNERTLGVSLEKGWDGEIKAIRSFRILIPVTMSIKDSKCSGLDFNVDSDGDYNIYTLAQPSSVRGFTDYKEFRCTVVFDDMDGILGTQPVATRFFQVEVDYTYKLDTKMSVTIKEEP